ncbi:MAG: hypothetical protein IBJ09_15530 [Bacteroidia bacterium]|nr:hypothetical protein [Bacteroidia bacterium]
MFEKDNIQRLTDEGYLQIQKHPDAELYIYNYAPKTQYEGFWNEITLQCRGLILDAWGNPVARPFAKFFNLGERPDEVLPDEPFEVLDKLDGSLGILYRLDGKPYIASRGSFTSEQAQEATRLLYEKYADAIPLLQEGFTYLFEIIYPENRIVVNYGTERALHLLAVIETATGTEHEPQDIGFPLAEKFHGIRDIATLKERSTENREGFVIRFRNGFRVKVKFEEYLRLHRIVTGVSNLSIWEMLRDGMPQEELLEHVPDEFYRWVKETIQMLQKQYTEIEIQSRSDFRILNTRKETALYFQTCKYPSVLFYMLDQKNYAPVIWKMIRPAYRKAWLRDEQTE